MRDALSERLAITAAADLKKRFDITENVPECAVILGTGWGNALGWKDEKRARFEDIPGFGELRPLEGHARHVVYGSVAGRSIIALQGRVHLNEAPADPKIFQAVRLQIEMLLQLGVKNLILTAAAGSLREEVHVGDIMVVDGFVSTYAPDMPLYAGEFKSPDDTLDLRLLELALAAVRAAGGEAKTGGYLMVRGPFFEGRKYDKPLLKNSGASTVGMSLFPEACIAALYPGVNVLALNFITNTAVEEHSHEVNQARAHEKSGTMGEVLDWLIHHIGDGQ